MSWFFRDLEYLKTMAKMDFNEFSSFLKCRARFGGLGLRKSGTFLLGAASSCAYRTGWGAKAGFGAVNTLKTCIFGAGMIY